MSPEAEAQLAHLVSTVEKALPYDALAARLALSGLLCAVTSTEFQLRHVTRELAELRAARPHLEMLRGGKP